VLTIAGLGRLWEGGDKPIKDLGGENSGRYLPFKSHTSFGDDEEVPGKLGSKALKTAADKIPSGEGLRI